VPNQNTFSSASTLGFQAKSGKLKSGVMTDLSDDELRAAIEKEELCLRLARSPSTRRASQRNLLLARRRLHELAAAPL